MKAMLHGTVLAFGLILPLGVQNLFLLCQGAFQPKFWRVLPGVVTAAVCDTFLIVLAVAGVTKLVAASVMAATLLSAAGCLLLVYLGWKTWCSGGEAAAGMKALSPLKQVGLAAGVSLGNPHAILDTIGVIGVASLQYAGEEKIVFSLACIAVSWLWFFSLAAAGRIFGSRFMARGRMLNKLAALCIWGAAVYLGARAI
ncbi:LysE/ArgO family amino acid transporter [Azotosporobacter soli]|uniref:LysE/ArgO family amino acid transporter n=1 Tax=Azotosporobacter soli TaxID=3055040 RepID=UPI0031FECB81